MKVKRHHSSKLRQYRYFGGHRDPSSFCGAGLELEIDSPTPNGKQFRAQLLRLIGKATGKRHFFVENDGSLRNGVEIITQPHTVDELKKFIYKHLKSLLIALSQTEAQECNWAGLHFHLSKTMFGATQSSQIESLAKQSYFFANNASFVKRAGRRPNYHKCFAPPASTKQQALAFVTQMIRRTDGYEKQTRYLMLNLKNKYTVEFRAAKTTLNTQDLVAQLDFTLHLANKSKTISWEDAHNVDAWLHDAPSNVKQYLAQVNAHKNIK